jgi:diaminopimelate epimerase
MRYAKGHGTGNDFVIVPDVDGRLDLSADLVRRLCDRRRGIGADGVLRVVAAAAFAPAGRELGAADWFMDYRNADGSIAEMCGNGIRVFAKYLIGHGLAVAPDLAIATSAGVRQVRLEGGNVFSVEMGPVSTGEPSWVVIGGQRLAGLPVSVGNPHLVCVVADPVAGFDLSEPPAVDRAVFPEGVNVEIVRSTGSRAIEMRVYERGSAETLSCGTGAVAAAVAAAAAAGEWPGDLGVPWQVDVPGGRLAVVPSATASLLTGPAVIVAEGDIDAAWLNDSLAATSVTT